MMRHLLFSVDHVECALPLDRVRIVLQMVKLGPAPEAIPGLAGSVNLHGHIIPAWSVRSLFGLPERAPLLTDRLIIAEIPPTCAALWVDETQVTRQDPVLPPQTDMPEKGVEILPGISRTGDGLFMIADLRQFLAPENSATLKAEVMREEKTQRARHA